MSITKAIIVEARPSRDVGEVADPQGVGARCLELPVDPVERAQSGRIGDRRPDRLAPHDTLQSHRPHQRRDGAPSHHDRFPAELPPDLAHAVDVEVRLEHALDLDHQRRVAPGPCRQLAEVGTPRGMGMVRRRGDRQHSADRLNPVGIAVLVEERLHRLKGGSSSAIAKYALAFRRISLA
jgi:hypothetical protein